MTLVAIFKQPAFANADRAEAEQYVTVLANATSPLIPHFGEGATNMQKLLANNALRTMFRHSIGDGVPPLSLPRTFEAMASALWTNVEATRGIKIAVNDNQQFANSFGPFQSLIERLGMVTNPTFYDQDSLMEADPKARGPIAQYLVGTWKGPDFESVNPITASIFNAALNYGG